MKRKDLKQRPKLRRIRKLLVRPEIWKLLVLIAKAISEVINIFGRFF
jgi:hypothetical protein